MYCNNCGAPNAESAKFCQNCGTKFTPVEVHQMNYKESQKPKKKGKKGWLVFFAVIIVLSLFSRGGKTAKTTQTQAAAQKPASVSSTTPTTAKVQQTTQPTVPPTPATPVFYIDLVYNAEKYNGKKVEVTVPVDYIYSSGRVTVKSDYFDGNLEIDTNDKSLYSKRDTIKYIAVSGTVAKTSSDISVKNAVVSYCGNAEPEQFVQDLANYEKYVVAGKIAMRNDFIAQAKTPSHDELRRSPDSYRDVPLKLNVNITKVETDGWISNGTVYATYNGQQIIIYDERENREPRLVAGDYITIYAKGNGLTVVKTFIKGSGILGSDLGAKETDKREEVCVKMVYADKEDVTKYGIQRASSMGVYDRGYTEYDCYLLGLKMQDSAN